MNDYRSALTLIKLSYEDENGDPYYDDVGNNIAVETRTDVLCAVQSISQGEFYNAAVTGLKPEKKFIIHPAEYHDEQDVEHEDKEYTVLRTYEADTERLELTVVRKIGNG